MRRRKIAITVAIFSVLIIFYEFAFRCCTSAWGEVDINASPPQVYYSKDLLLPFPLLKDCFSVRTQLPFGKIRLSEGTGLYVDGGRFYRRMPDGNWKDLTDVMIEEQKKTL